MLLLNKIILRLRINRFIQTAIYSLFGCLIACGEITKDKKTSSQSIKIDSNIIGHQLFNSNCVSCHKASEELLYESTNDEHRFYQILNGNNHISFNDLSLKEKKEIRIYLMKIEKTLP